MSQSNPASITAYLTEPVIADLEDVASKLDRTPSWLLRKAWELARDQIVEPGKTQSKHP
jgi:hypothetical protein